LDGIGGLVNRIVLKKIHRLPYYKSHPHIVNSTVPQIERASSLLIRFAIACCVLLSAGCSRGGSEAVRVEGGDAQAGKRLIAQYQCGACHAIPGIPGATGDTGPSLRTVGRLSYIAGGIPNQPARLVAFLRDPPALKPDTPMPALGLTEQEARHMAAYLYTLR
jgi:cytochrome c